MDRRRAITQEIASGGELIGENIDERLTRKSAKKAVKCRHGEEFAKIVENGGSGLVTSEALDQEPSLHRLLAHRAISHLRQAPIAGVAVACPCLPLRRRRWPWGLRSFSRRLSTGIWRFGRGGSDGSRVGIAEVVCTAVSSAAIIQIRHCLPHAKRNNLRKIGFHRN